MLIINVCVFFLSLMGMPLVLLPECGVFSFLLVADKEFLYYIHVQIIYDITQTWYIWAY